MLKTPTPEEIKQTRLDLKLTQAEAAKLVHVQLRSWQMWEAGDRKMSLAAWELFLIKTKRKTK